ncbi:MAG: hypothetical protein CMM87_05945 [Rickettsiales bacterium]|nr:hypothetical protein [Rickettsiales bacterium]|tara:strand:+ start:13747 stop:14706 length:960 start_codon:yes stop_codon:yes gene_type:complete
MKPSYKTLSLFLLLCLVFITNTCLSKDPTSLVRISSPFQDLWLFSNIRLPRLLLAMLTGAGYGLTGLLLQTYLRTPLADANLIGLGSFAALGTLIGLAIGIQNSALLILCACFCTLLIPIFYHYFLQHRIGQTFLVLMGLCLTTFVQGLVSLLIYIIHQNFPLSEMLFWLFGSFGFHTLDDVMLILPPLTIGFLLLFHKRQQYNFLCLSNESIFASGIQLGPLGLRLVLGCTLILGPIIAMTGLIGFIGIGVPHVIRLLYHKPPSHLMIPCMIAGAILCLVADMLVRLLPLSYEINVGIFIALINAPVFIHLLWSRSHA